MSYYKILLKNYKILKFIFLLIIILSFFQKKYNYINFSSKIFYQILIFKQYNFVIRNVMLLIFIFI